MDKIDLDLITFFVHLQLPSVLEMCYGTHFLSIKCCIVCFILLFNNFIQKNYSWNFYTHFLPLYHFHGSSLFGFKFNNLAHIHLRINMEIENRMFFSFCWHIFASTISVTANSKLSCLIYLNHYKNSLCDCKQQIGLNVKHH